ncbi:MAG: hypothetical protein LQ338_002908 [Usnochroma carphineum]|nr:MAG: hypothetical protein LQ338_002908 [Usnochroma carphineum]
MKKFVPVTVSPRTGKIGLLFYVPIAYATRSAGQKYPVLVNFHGGGFTIGSAADDARFAHAVTSQSDAVFVSVNYRLAPEYPFPTAVEDGVDAILYLAQHADELGIDAQNMAVNGFSAGGNLAFSVPLLLHDWITRSQAAVNVGDHGKVSDKISPTLANFKIRAIMAWYPSLDFTVPRAARKATNPRQDKELPTILTDLFDAAYSTTGESGSPYLSPAAAPTRLLTALPDVIVLYPCQWDGLAAEARRFKERLEHETDKKTVYCIIADARHGFDRAPNPFRSSTKREKYYKQACDELLHIFASP